MQSASAPKIEVTPAARRPRAAHTLGLVGGGQLAKMLAQSALQLGCDVVVLERKEHSPASQLASETIIGDWDTAEALLELASRVDVIALENEFVDSASLAVVERAGYLVWPPAAAVRTIQDKLWQKDALAKAGLPLPGFAATPDKKRLIEVGEKFGWPLVLKKRRNGYDGKGNWTLKSAGDLEAAWMGLSGDKNALYAEQFCPYTSELAIMIVRGRQGEMISYPLVETVQHHHICHIVRAPAKVSAEISARATQVALRAVEAVGAVGAVGVEMFLLADGQILINELAPRVHNSGHYTIEGCVCSQFENHVRAVFGWPLGSTAMVAPAAVMINLLGAGHGSGRAHGLEKALAVPGAHPHIYGKARSVPGRKMGHLTALGANSEEAFELASRAANCITFGDQ